MGGDGGLPSRRESAPGDPIGAPGLAVGTTPQSISALGLAAVQPGGWPAKGKRRTRGARALPHLRRLCALLGALGADGGHHGLSGRRRRLRVDLGRRSVVEETGVDEGVLVGLQRPLELGQVPQRHDVVDRDPPRLLEGVEALVHGLEAALDRGRAGW